MDSDDATTRFMATVDRLLKAAPARLQPTGAAIIAAMYQGIGSDSRGLSSKLGIAHALVLREINELSGAMLHIVERDDRTQRTFVALTQEAQIIARAAVEVVIEPSVSSRVVPEMP